MKRVAMTLAAGAMLLTGQSLKASGLLGIYALVERVVFEPDVRSPERIRISGAFAFVDGGAPAQLAPGQVTLGGRGSISSAKRGYMYFRLPDDPSLHAAVRTEWNDIRGVAGTGQAIGFGRWGYIAAFRLLQPDQKPTPPSTILPQRARVSEGLETDLRVFPEIQSSPAVIYRMNAGVVKLDANGTHAEVVRQLRTALN